MGQFSKIHGRTNRPWRSIDYTIPTYSSIAQAQEGELFDYMGIPTGIANIFPKISALPARCSNLIWNQWFRDENLQDSLTVDMDDGPDNPNQYWNLQRRGKRHDYFTSALPWAQKGAAIDLPLGTTAPVISTR